MGNILRCEHCYIETTGARDDQGRVWAICGECLHELLLQSDQAVAHAVNGIYARLERERMAGDSIQQPEEHS